MDKEGIIDKFTYQYDSLGNKTVVNKERRGMPEENGIYTYQYDPVGRVKSVAKNATVLKTYTYDAVGNRTKLVEEGTETLYTQCLRKSAVVRQPAFTGGGGSAGESHGV